LQHSNPLPKPKISWKNNSHHIQPQTTSATESKLQFKTAADKVLHSKTATTTNYRENKKLNSSIHLQKVDVVVAIVVATLPHSQLQQAKQKARAPANSCINQNKNKLICYRLRLDPWGRYNLILLLIALCQLCHRQVVL
jgi:hypothetical protein